MKSVFDQFRQRFQKPKACKTHADQVQFGVIPKTYAQWCLYFDVIKEASRDEEALLLLSQGEMSWTNGVAQRFAEQLNDVFDCRLQVCSQRLSRVFAMSYDEASLLQGLISARQTLVFLHRIATLPNFDEILQNHLIEVLSAYATRTQKSLEDSAKSDRSGRLTSLIKHNSILTYKVIAEQTVNANINSQSNSGGLNNGVKKRTFL